MSDHTPSSATIPTPDDVHDMLAHLLANGRKIDPVLQEYCRRISKAYRSLEADHRTMREAIDFACDDCSCSDCDENAELALAGKQEMKPCGKHYRLEKALSSLQVRE